MSTGFNHIRQIDEDSNGLRVTLAEAHVGHLRRDHQAYQGLRDLLLELLHDTQTGGVPQPTWLALDDDGVITEVRLVGQGIPLSATRDDSGQYLIVFPFTNISLKLRTDHPRFREFEGYLTAALEHETPLYYVGAAEDFYSIDDMLPALPSHQSPHDRDIAVASGAAGAEHGE
jgi:hypothetical protein